MNPTHAVMCPRHAVYVGSSAHNAESDAAWILLPFQRGEGRFYKEHLHRAVHLTAHDPGAVLILSGGQTRREAESYFDLANQKDWFGLPAVRQRTISRRVLARLFREPAPQLVPV